MNAFISLSEYQAEALVACLLASVVWAGLLLFGARLIERRRLAANADRVWIAALMIAILPSLLAPTLAGLGVSLRPAAATAEIAAPIGDLPARTLAVEGAGPAPSIAASQASISPDQIVGGAAMLYIYGVLLALIIWAGRQLAFSFATARARPIEDRALSAAINEWADAMGVAPPRVRRSRHISSVCVHGALRPAILIPEDIESRVTREDLALMCAHELAHLKRGDTKLFTATALARVLFWFNPLVREIAARVELAAEERADALVLGAGVDRRAYAACFVKGLRFAASRTGVQPALMPSFTPPDREGRQRRLRSILSGAAPSRLSFSARLMLGGAASAAALLAVGQAALAVDPEAAAEKKRAAEEAALSHKPVKGEATLGYAAPYSDLENGEARTHSGVDIAAPLGEAVVAAGDGVVVEATDFYKDNLKWGKVVVIDHGHGVVSRYAHLDGYSVRKGDTVKGGEKIGAVGATGKVTGPHLHFEVLKDGKSVDPEAAFARADFDAPSAPPAPEPLDDVDAPDAIFAIEAPQAPAPSAAPEAPDAPAPAARKGYSFSFSGAPMDAMARLGELPIVVRLGEHDDLAERLGGLANLEDKLLGSIEGDLPENYNITYNVDGKVFRFSSDEPLTPEKRAELKEAIEKSRAARDKARIEARKANEAAKIEWRREAAAWRARSNEDRKAWEKEVRLLREEAEAASNEGRAIAMVMSRVDVNEMRREAVEAELAAIEEAHIDLDDASNADFDEALSDLEIDAADIDAADLTDEEREHAVVAIRNAREQVEAAREDHERAIKRARDQLDERREELRRELRALDKAETR